MKKKIHKLLGVALTAVLLTTLTIGLVAVPASAGTLSWTTESIPGAAGKMILACDVVDFAVAHDGTTIYAATGDTYASATGKGGLFKSSNGGITWSDVVVPHTVAVSTVKVSDSVDVVAVAPDNPNMVAIIADGNEVYVSSNGGTSFNALGIPDGVTTLYCIDISMPVGGVHNVAVGGDGAGAELWYFNFGAAVPSWTEATVSPWEGFTTSNVVKAVKFSPNFMSDFIITCVSEVDDAATAADYVHFQIGSFNSRKWNTDGGFTGYPVVIETDTDITALDSASIVLASTYLGADTTARLAFVSAAITDTTAPNVPGGIYRLTDTGKKALLATAAKVHSVDYNTTADKLVAGLYGSNAVYRCANPLTAAPTLIPTSGTQRPGGVDKVVAAFAGDTVVAGTSGDESAFAVSKDDGATFNDVSLIDTALTTLADFAVSADGSQIYLVTQDAGDADAGYEGRDISLWHYASSWERVLNLKLASNEDVPLYIVRLAPEDAAVVYLGEQSGTTIYYSTDSGEASWTFRACGVTLVDMVAESASVLYAVNEAGVVVKSTNAGFIWGPPRATGATGATIVSLSEDNLIVGGDDGTVAYSIDGNASWTKISPTIVVGNVQVTADGLATGDHIYAVSSNTGPVANYVYRWTIGTNTTAWTKISAVTATTFNFYGIGLSGGVLYAVGYDTGGISTCYRSLAPTASTVPFSTMATATDVKFDTAPSALRISTSSVKLWAIDTQNDKLYSYTDTLTEVGPTLTAPADGSTIAMNPVTGHAYNVAFNWERPSLANAYTLTIALDSSFTQRVRTETIPAEGTTTASTVVAILGPFSAIPKSDQGCLELMPETTYYWKVAVNKTGPVSSPSSATWSFTVAPAIEPPAPVLDLEPELFAPAYGATGVSVFPTFAWSAIDGAIKYELEVAKDANFAEKWISMSGRNALTTSVYISEQQLDYATTYYWRVDCYADGEWGDWVTGIFTTEATSVTPPAEMHTCPLCGLEYPTQQALADHYAKYHAPVPVAAETPMYMWVIIGIGAVLVITMIILIVRTRRAV